MKFDGYIDPKYILKDIICNNSYKQALNKLKNALETGKLPKSKNSNSMQKVYTFNLPNAGRLLYSVFTHENKNYIVLTRLVKNHRYDRSPDMKEKNVVDNFINELKSDSELSDKIKTKKDLDKLLSNNNDSKIKYEDDQQSTKSIKLTPSQQSVISSGLPMITNGCAGAGKTLIARKLMRNAIKGYLHNKLDGAKILYVCKSKNLAKYFTHLWQDLPDISASRVSVEILTYDQLIKQAYGKDIKILKINDFEVWYKSLHNKQKPKLKAKITSRQIFKELETIAVLDHDYKNHLGLNYLNDCEESDEGSSAEQESIRQASVLKSYKEIGARNTRIDKDADFKGLFALYTYLKSTLHNSGAIYPALTVIKPRDIYDLVVTDESQGFSRSELVSLIGLSKRDAERFVRQICIFMDPNQSYDSIYSSKSFIKEILPDNLNQHTLSVTHRTPANITKFINQILKLKYLLTSGVLTDGEYVALDSKVDFESNVGCFLASEVKSSSNLQSIISKPDTAIIIPDEECREEAAKKFKTQLIFTPEQIIGLEYRNIILYRLLEGESLAKLNKKLRQINLSEFAPKQNKTNLQTSELRQKEESISYINRLFIGATRAKKELYIVEQSKKRINKIWDGLRSVIDLDQQKIEKPKEKVVVDLKIEKEKWIGQVLQLIDNERMDVARRVCRANCPELSDLFFGPYNINYDKQLNNESYIVAKRVCKERYSDLYQQFFNRFNNEQLSNVASTTTEHKPESGLASFSSESLKKVKGIDQNKQTKSIKSGKRVASSPKVDQDKIRRLRKLRDSKRLKSRMKPKPKKSNRNNELNPSNGQVIDAEKLINTICDKHKKIKKLNSDNVDKIISLKAEIKKNLKLCFMFLNIQSLEDFNFFINKNEDFIQLLGSHLSDYLDSWCEDRDIIDMFIENIHGSGGEILEFLVKNNNELRNYILKNTVDADKLVKTRLFMKVLQGSNIYWIDNLFVEDFNVEIKTDGGHKYICNSLGYAIFRGLNKEIIKLLSKKDSSDNVAITSPGGGDKGFGALAFAVHLDNSKMVSLLLDLDVDYISFEELVFLFGVSLNSEDKEVAKTLFDWFFAESDLFFDKNAKKLDLFSYIIYLTIRLGCKQRLRDVIEKVKQVNLLKDIFNVSFLFNKTLLYIASELCKPKIAEILLSYGADPNVICEIKDDGIDRKETALIVAARNNNMGVMFKLLKAKADSSIKGTEGNFYDVSLKYQKNKEAVNFRKYLSNNANKFNLSLSRIAGIQDLENILNDMEKDFKDASLAYDAALLNGVCVKELINCVEKNGHQYIILSMVLDNSFLFTLSAILASANHDSEMIKSFRVYLVHKSLFDFEKMFEVYQSAIKFGHWPIVNMFTKCIPGLDKSAMDNFIRGCKNEDLVRTFCLAMLGSQIEVIKKFINFRREDLVNYRIKTSGDFMLSFVGYAIFKGVKSDVLELLSGAGLKLSSDAKISENENISAVELVAICNRIEMIDVIVKSCKQEDLKDNSLIDKLLVTAVEYNNLEFAKAVVARDDLKALLSMEDEKVRGALRSISSNKDDSNIIISSRSLFASSQSVSEDNKESTSDYDERPNASII